MHRSFILVLSVMILSACANASDESDLKNRIDEYYSFQKNDDWKSSFKLRSSRFKSNYEEEYYIEEMGKYDYGWSLLNYKIKSMQEDGHQINVVMIFKEKLDNGIDSAKEINIEQEDVWVKEGSEWFLERAASRAHLPFTE